MVFDNKLEAAKFRFFFNIILAIQVMFIVLYFMTMVPAELILLRVGFTGLIIGYLILLAKKPMYFYLRDDGSKITVRFYFLHPFFKKLKAIEIPKNQFVRYEIVSSMFGLRKDLYLYVKNGASEYMYPPISISINDKKMIGNIRKLLSAYIRK